MGLLGLEEHALVWFAYFGDFREWGVDVDGRLMRLSDHGKDTPYGWHIDHSVPSGVGGSNALANKRPRHRIGNALAGGLLGTAMRSSPDKQVNALAVALTAQKPGLF